MDAGMPRRDALSLPAGEALSKVRGERGAGAGPGGELQPGRDRGVRQLRGWCRDSPGCSAGGSALSRLREGSAGRQAADLPSQESCRLWLRVLKMSATLFAR